MGDVRSSASPIRRAWHRAPYGLRQGVNVGMTALAQMSGQVRGQLERGGKPSGKVCVMGLHRAVLGIGRGARLFQSALDEMGMASTAWDVSELLGNDLTLPAPSTDFADVTTVVTHLNPIEHLRVLGLAKGPRPKRGFRVGYWAWETSEVPADWIKGIAAVDEIWCPSSFTARSVEKLVANRRPVRVVPHPIPKGLIGLADKARFGISTEKVTFFTACDLFSSLARKNPFGAIEAFRRSGCGVRGEAELLVKVHGHGDSEGLLELNLAAQKTPGVTIMDRKLSADDMRALRSSIDVVLSPHRSEGFGLVLAEAMRAGKPVVATGWSGNMDFMDETSAALIDYKVVPVKDPSGVYLTGTWAEPDLDHAGALILKLANDHQMRQQLGQAGLAHIGKFADMSRWQHTIRGLLNCELG